MLTFFLKHITFHLSCQKNPPPQIAMQLTGTMSLNAAAAAVPRPPGVVESSTRFIQIEESQVYHFWWPCTGVMSRASISNLSTVLFRNYRKSFSSRLNGAHAELQPLTNNRGSCWVINVLCALLCAVARGLVPGSLISTSFQEIDWYKQSDLIVIYYVIFWKAQGRRFFLAFEPPISCAVNGGPPVGNGDRSWSARSCYHPEVVWMVSSRVRLHRNCARIMQKGVFPAWLLSRFPTSVGSWHSPDQGKVCCYGNSCRWGACWTQGLHDPLHFPP